MRLQVRSQYHSQAYSGVFPSMQALAPFGFALSSFTSSVRETGRSLATAHQHGPEPDLLSVQLCGPEFLLHMHNV
jgi:hypothetical protein